VYVEQPVGEDVTLRGGADITLDHYDLEVPTTSRQQRESSDSLYPPRNDLVMGMHLDAVIQAADRWEVTPGIRVDMFESVRNLANVSRECQVSRKTVEGYLEILEDLLLGFRLPVFTRRARRQLASHPKFYFFDAGVFRANRRTGPLDSTGEIEGAALEGLVAQHLHAWCDYSRGKHELHYWQTRSRAEVDFVVYGESGLYAVEVKNSKRVQPADLTALKGFAEDYPQSSRFLLYRGDDRIKRDGVLCIPCEEFLLAFPIILHLRWIGLHRSFNGFFDLPFIQNLNSAGCCPSTP
jgi:hypothetical protein